MRQPYMDGKKNKDVTEGLARVLADTFVLYFKTHAFHWNVTGVQFKALHELFEEQYTELWNAVDELAERIRALDAWAATSMKEIQDKATLREVGQLPDADEMVKALAADNRAIVDSLYSALRAAQDAGDEATTDMLIARVQVHEKAAWMLESIGRK
ncbi:MAG: DNA starvation/stationary phase protection protein [Alphaproteobacteria bacterium]|nr:DNA starvation/stationary phase protection protein [Alphaproteobacteria bacterium]